MTNVLTASWLDTPLGPMLAIANDEALYLLEFGDQKGLERKLDRLKTTAAIIPGSTPPIRSIENELALYFEGKLSKFKTPLFLSGTPFQISVWNELKKIPFGKTKSYADIAHAIQKPKGYRAVAQANGANPVAIIVPCHRVINESGELGGYSGGIWRKQWLLDHENCVVER